MAPVLTIRMWASASSFLGSKGLAVSTLRQSPWDHHDQKLVWLLESERSGAGEPRHFRDKSTNWEPGERSHWDLPAQPTLSKNAAARVSSETAQPAHQSGKKFTVILSHFSLGEFVMQIRVTVALTFGSGTNCLMSLSLGFLISTYFIGLWWALNVMYQSMC